MNTQTLHQLQPKSPDDLDNAIDWFVALARIARQDGAVKWHPKQLETFLKQVANYAEENLDFTQHCSSEDITTACIVAAHVQIKSEYERLINSPHRESEVNVSEAPSN